MKLVLAQRITTRDKSRRAFTLIELIVVIMIIAILMGLMLAVVRGVVTMGKRKKTEAQIEAIQMALTRYFSEFGEYPEVLNGSPDPRTQATTLYQACTGDGSDNIQGANPPIPSTGESGSATDGKVFLDSAIWDPKKTGGFVHPEKFLQDPFGNPYRYVRAGPGIDTKNPTYDLWSWAADDNGDIPEEWITNWQ